MPKLKTHKGASKRFKKTGTGLVVRNHAFGRHILTSKPHKRKKKLHQSVVADKADQKVLKRMLEQRDCADGARGTCPIPPMMTSQNKGDKRAQSKPWYPPTGVAEKGFSPRIRLLPH